MAGNPRYRALKLPLTQSDTTRPVYDSNGALVSFTENAQTVVKALNFVWALAEMDCGKMIVEGNASHALAMAAKKAKEIAG